MFFHYKLSREKGLEYIYIPVHIWIWWRGHGIVAGIVIPLRFKNFISIMRGKAISWDPGSRGYGGWLGQRHVRWKKTGHGPLWFGCYKLYELLWCQFTLIQYEVTICPTSRPSRKRLSANYTHKNYKWKIM